MMERNKKCLSLLLCLISIFSWCFYGQPSYATNNNTQAVIENPQGVKQVDAHFDTPLKAGDTVIFNIDVTPAQDISIWLMGKTTNTEYHAKRYDTWTGEITITVPITAAEENYKIIVNYNDNSQDFKQNVVTISHIEIKNYGIQTLVQDDGTVILKNEIDGAQQLDYHYDIPLQAGQVVTFCLDVTPAQDISVWLVGKTTNLEHHAKQYSVWKGKQEIAVPITTYEANFKIIVNYNDTTQNFKQNVLTISDVKVHESQEVAVDDRTVILKNEVKKSYCAECYKRKIVKAGETISFHVDVSPAQNIVVWVFGDNMMGGEYFAKKYKANEEIDVEVSFKNKITQFTIRVEYLDMDTELENNIVHIEKIKVG